MLTNASPKPPNQYCACCHGDHHRPPAGRLLHGQKNTISLYSNTLMNEYYLMRKILAAGGKRGKSLSYVNYAEPLPKVTSKTNVRYRPESLVNISPKHLFLFYLLLRIIPMLEGLQPISFHSFQ